MLGNAACLSFNSRDLAVRIKLLLLQIYEFSLTVSTGSADSGEVYSLLRSDTVSVKVQVRNGGRVPQKFRQWQENQNACEDGNCNGSPGRILYCAKSVLPCISL